MTNAQLNYIHSLLIKYKKKLCENSNENTNSELTMIITGFQIIESDNRFIIWRIFEYIAVLYNWLLHLLFTRPIINYSIGKYQLKINYILEDLKLDYHLKNKAIFLKRKINLIAIIQIILLSNNYNCFERILKSKFTFEWERLSSDQLKKVALFYSRNTEFVGGFNYFVILEILYRSSDGGCFKKDSNIS